MASATAVVDAFGTAYALAHFVKQSVKTIRYLFDLYDSMVLRYQCEPVHLGRLKNTVSLGPWSSLLDSSSFDIVHSVNRSASPNQSAGASTHVTEYVLQFALYPYGLPPELPETF